MIDHLSLGVSDLARSAAFYDAVLEPLGYRRIVDLETRVGFGKRYPEIWLNARPGMAPVGDGHHVCLRARTEDAVRRFHDAALDAGGRSDGEPGPRQAALTTYFGAFIVDPDGNRLEAASFPEAG
ncbi:MAG TPA: VOC family protein [Caulobacteraceae bacterium]|nr:VOC family protein [Caulobacteraceae bacterium]